MDAEKWIKEHLDRLHEESAEWPAWMQSRMKPPRDETQRRDLLKREIKGTSKKRA